MVGKNQLFNWDVMSLPVGQLGAVKRPGLTSRDAGQNLTMGFGDDMGGGEKYIDPVFRSEPTF